MARIVETSNKLTSPVWAADYLSRDHLIPGGFKVDPTLFTDSDAVVVTVATGGAAIGATSVPVTALSGAIPNGTVLDFTGANKWAQLTVAAAAGATTLTVVALVQALVAGDVATYPGLGTGLKTVRSGTALGWTYAERDGTPPVLLGPAAAADDEVFLLAFDIVDADINNDAVMYRPGSVVKENFLPDYATLTAGVLAKIRAAYQTQKGVA